MKQRYFKTNKHTKKEKKRISEEKKEKVKKNHLHLNFDG